jgi:nucleoside-diphosphate-sugar epimerase
MIAAPEFHKLVQANIMYLDNSKIKKLGYVQQYDIKQSVASLAEYYANE